MVITDNYKKSFSEVNTILNNIPEEMNSKIPIELKKIIDEEKLESYTPKLDKLIIEKNIMPESIALLGLIYRDYLSPEELRQTLKIRDDIEFKEYQVLEAKKYNNIFKKQYTKPEKIYESITETAVVEHKKKWYEKLLDFFRKK